LTTRTTRMRIGFIGLGRMGANMVRGPHRDGQAILAFNRTADRTRSDAKVLAALRIEFGGHAVKSE